MSLEPSPMTRSPSRRPGRLPWAGTVSKCPPSSTRAPSGPASRPVSPRSRAPGSSAATWAAIDASSRDSEGMSISSSVRAASRSPRSWSLGAMSGHHTRMRFCGIDVSARPDNQQLCTLHERKGTEGIELVATFYAPGTVEQRGPHDPGLRARRGGRRHRRAVRPPARPARPRRGRARPARPARRPLRAHAGVRRRALPPRAAALPGAGGGRGGAGVDGGRLRAVRRAVAARPLDPGRRQRRARGRGRRLRDALGARVRDLPRRDLLRAARPPPAAQAHAVGRPAADRGAQAQGRLRRRRRALAPHARRDRRLRGRLRRLRA